MLSTKTLPLSILLVAALALSASASSIDLLTLNFTTLPCPTCGGQIVFTNAGGTLSYSNGFILTGSTLVSVFTIPGGLVTGNLGTVTFITPPLQGSLQMGGTFGPGGHLFVRGNGTNGIPNKGLLNSYFGGGTWTLETLPDGTHQYVLATEVGPFRTVQVTVNTGTGFFNGSVGLAAGHIAVPEPGTLGLLGTGLGAIAGLRRKRNVFS